MYYLTDKERGLALSCQPLEGDEKIYLNLRNCLVEVR